MYMRNNECQILILIFVFSLFFSVTEQHKQLYIFTDNTTVQHFYILNLIS